MCDDRADHRSGVADLIESQTELVTERFGPAAMVTITRHLQAQTDIPSTKIVDLFMETFHISRLVIITSSCDLL